jgi:hypothetical protein
MRALYDPPFFFEWTPSCLTVYKRENDVYTKYRMLSQDDAKRIYPDVMHWLESGKSNETDKAQVAVALAEKLGDARI